MTTCHHNSLLQSHSYFPCLLNADKTLCQVILLIQYPQVKHSRSQITELHPVELVWLYFNRDYISHN